MRAKIAYRTGWLIVLAVCILPSQRARGDEVDGETSVRITALIEDLDSDKFSERDSATQALIKIGPPALAPLRAMLPKAESAEAKVRIEKIIEELEVWGGPRSDIRLEEILTRARVAAKNGGRDKQLETLLKRLVRVLGSASGNADLKLPVEFDDVKPATDQRTLRGNLLVADDLSRTSAHDSIIIASGFVDISSAQNCIIIAGLAAEVSFCRNCLVISGAAIDVSHLDDSILMSGWHLEVSIGEKSIIASSEPPQTSIFRGSTIINTRPARDRLDDGTRVVRVPRLVLSDPNRQNPLEEVVSLTFSSSSRDGIALFRLADGTGEYVARRDAPIKHPNGREISALQGLAHALRQPAICRVR